MGIWARSLLLILQLAYSTMPKGPGERLVFWLSTASFVAPSLGAAGIGQKCLITGSFKNGAGNVYDVRLSLLIALIS